MRRGDIKMEFASRKAVLPHSMSKFTIYSKSLQHQQLDMSLVASDSST